MVGVYSLRGLLLCCVQNFMTSTVNYNRDIQLKSAIEYSLADLGLIDTPPTSASSSPPLSVNSLTMSSNWCPLAHTVDDMIYQVSGSVSEVFSYWDLFIGSI